jgi:NitT/TauT family transport system substrate-binding protein
MRQAYKFSFVALTAVALLGACSSRNQSASTIRVGFFPNITHSQALIGLSRGDFRTALGPGVTIDAKAFNAGPSVIEALFAGQIDLAYIGPNPAINGYVKSKGAALRVIAGAVSGGAALVVREDSGISTPSDMAGKTIATPQLGNTQDVALRGYLKSIGLSPRENGGTVTVQPMENPTILDAFRQNRIDGAWVPEPWASRLELEGNGRLLIDERTLWKDGRFSAALLIVSKKFLEKHPDMVKAWLRVHVRITQWEIKHPDEAILAANTEIKRLTGKELSNEVLRRAWSRMEPTFDPLTPTLQKASDSAFAAGFLKEKPDLSGIADLSLLNEVLAEIDLPAVH